MANPLWIVSIKLEKPIETTIKKFKQVCLTNKLNSLFDKAAPNIRDEFAILIAEAIARSPEYNSLLGNGAPSLKEHFGMPDAERRINAVITAWVNNTFIKVTPFKISGRQIRGGIRLGIVRKDLSDVLGVGAFITPDIKRFRIDWLEWLMHEGDTQIILDSHIAIGDGRAGDYVMRDDGSWGIPSEFAGFIGDNFVTRSAKGLEKDFAKIVKQEIARAN